MARQARLSSKYGLFVIFQGGILPYFYGKCHIFMAKTGEKNGVIDCWFRFSILTHRGERGFYSIKP